MALRVERKSLKICALLKMETGVLADCSLGCLPVRLKSMSASKRARKDAQIVLWRDCLLEDMILKEVHTGIPFGQSLLFGKAEGSLVE